MQFNTNPDNEADGVTPLASANKGLTCLYLPASEPAGYQVGTLYTDGAGNVKAVMAT